MNKYKILKSLKADLKDAEQLRNDWDDKISKWKDAYNGELYGNEKKGKSKIISRDIRRQEEWLHASIIETFVATPDLIKASPVTYEDKASARQNELLLNTQFCRQFNRYSFMTKAIKVLAIEGTVVVQTGWEYEEEEVETECPIINIDPLTGEEYINGTEIVKEVKIVKNRPTAVIRRNEDIFIDPTCQDDMDNCQFVIVRYETDLSTLRKDGRYKNLDKVAKANLEETDTDYEDEDDTEFQFRDDPRKKLVVYEYWGNYDINEDGIAEPIVCSWIGDIIIRLQDNPYPDKKPPFIIVPFSSVPFQMFGEANAELIADNQKVKTAITRGIIDNMAQSNNGQIGIRKGALDYVNMKKMQNGQNFEFNGTPNDFWQGNFNQIPQSTFNMLSMMNNEIESITGINSYTGGLNGRSLGATATGIKGTLDASSTRKLNIVRNIAENLIKPLMRKWMAYNSEFLDEEEIVRVTNEEFVPIRRDDLAGRIDIDIQVSTPEDNHNKAQELSFLLQTLGNTMPFEMTQQVMAEIARLYKMPMLEHNIKEFKQPEPTQEDQLAKQLQLEKMKLENDLIKARIVATYNSAYEDEADKEVKLAKAELDKAKIRNLESKTDREDLAFLKEDEDIKHKQEMEKELWKAKLNLDQMMFQAQHMDNNIGVLR